MVAIVAVVLAALKAIGACVAAFLVVSLLPWLRDVWHTRHIPPYMPPLPFIGDLPEISKKGSHKVMEERAAKYGKIFKIWVGPRPYVLTADPESSRRVLNRLLNRYAYPTTGNEDVVCEGGRDLFSLKGERWRRMRLAWLPSFAPPSLARYAPLMDGCATKVAARLEPLSENGEEFDMWRLIGAMTLDVVGTTAFGMRFNALGDDDFEKKEKKNDKNGDDKENKDRPDGERLVAAARAIFADDSLSNPGGYMGLVTMFPLASPLWKALAARWPDAKLKELNAARDVLRQSAAVLVRQQRRREAEAAAEAAAAEAEAEGDATVAVGRRDQQQEEAKAPPADGKKAAPVASAVSKGVMPGSFLAQLLKPQAASARPGAEVLPPLSEEDAVANASLFVLAGYETTANTLACCFYGLATTPAASRRVCAEVDAFFASEGRDAPLTPEAVAAHFPFCEAALKEALRMWSPLPSVDREVNALPGGGDPHAHRADLFSSAPPGSAGAAGGPSLRPGITVAAANWVYQRSEEYWPRALEFLPERWVPEEKGGAASVLGPTTPSAWSPFGGGTRACVGLKFATLEMIITLVRLYEKFEFVPSPSQAVPMRMKEMLTLSPDGGVNLVVRRRHVAAAGCGDGDGGQGALAA